MSRWQPSGSHHPCVPCGWSSSWWGSHPYSSFHLSPLSPCGTCGSRMCLVHCGHGDVWEARRALEPWGSVVGALPSFLGVALEEPPQLPSPLHCCWACCQSLWWTSWGQTQCTLSCGYAGQRMTQRPASGTSCTHSWHCSEL